MRKLLQPKRASGILLHITSLPGPYGIGEIGDEAKSFIDDLVKMNQHYWQILPTNYPETCNSPYDTNSAFAQNPFLISIDSLIQDGLIKKNDLEPIPDFRENQVEFEKLKNWKSLILKKAAYNFLKSRNKDESKAYNDFCLRQGFWLNDYALFMVIKNLQNKKNWAEWDSSYKHLDEKVMVELGITYRDEVEEIKIMQYLFNKQWKNLKAYASKRGVELIGDIPIYISFNSADVWKNQSLFKLNDDCHMQYQSGCPPDEFMDTGQLWGHPIYDWQKHSDSGFNWWINRIEYLMQYVDIIRIDHFNGFAKYWEVPAKDSTAIHGKWIKAKGSDLLAKVFRNDSEIYLIAEDLGEATADAAIIREKYNIPGMGVLQFAFYDQDPLVNLKENTVLYTGTHDNDTSVGWYNSLRKESSKGKIDSVKNILDLDSKEVNWSMIEYSLQSKALTVMVPLQDILGLGSEARMNTPGTVSDKNWSWRMTTNNLNDSMVERMKKITKKANRL